MNKIEKHLKRAGAFDCITPEEGSHSMRGMLQCLRTWTREPDEDIPWLVHEMGRMLPCCWHGTGQDHPRFRMVERAQLLWCGWFEPLIRHPRPVDFDCAPLYMDQLYYEFFLGYVRPSDSPGGYVQPPKCEICGRHISSVIGGLCGTCEASGYYPPSAQYAALEECYRCGERVCICDDDDADGETDDYEDEEWEDEHL